MDLPIRMINYIIHRISSSSGRIGNAFIREFGQNILRDTKEYPEYQLIEKYRNDLFRNSSIPASVSLGAGTFFGNKNRRISHIARIASVNANYGQLLFRMTRYYKPDQIIELGTALGISTMYLAMGNPDARIITVEGNPKLAGIASKIFAHHGMENITLINSSFDDAIPRIIPEVKNNALVFIDGNHTLEATIRYYEVFCEASRFNNILVLDDINWSHDMAKAWKIITGEKCQGLIVDLFRFGIVFNNPDQTRQKFRLRY